jgi:hypothetical protein
MKYPETSSAEFDECFKRISLIKSTFRYCSNGELGKSMGVYDSAAKQIVEHVEQLQALLSRLQRKLTP